MLEANDIINIIWTALEPFRALYTSYPAKPATHLTQLFIEIIYITFLCIALFTIFRTLHSLVKINRSKRILGGFRNIDTDKEQFLQAVPPSYAHFAVYLSEYNGKLYLDQDCDNVLSDLWYPPILRSYLLPAGAAILTGIGVLGTFLGLLMGIQDLALEDLGAIHTGIINVAGGASTAFETSVWGVALSLLLTLIEKLASAYIKGKYIDYQITVSTNFPPLPLGEIFLDIKTETSESRNVLDGLAEQISNSMQTSLDSFIQQLLDHLSGNITRASSSISESISDSLVEAINTSMAPAIDRIAQVSQNLADRQARGSEEALGTLLQSFSGKLTAEGDNQRLAMQAASQEMGQNLAAFTEKMASLIRSVIDKSHEMSQTQSGQLRELQAAFERQHEINGQSMDRARQDMLSLVENFSRGVQKELGTQASQLGQITEGIEMAMQTMGERMSDFMAALATQQEAEASAQEARSKTFEEGTRKTFEEYANLLSATGQQIQAQLKSVKAIMDQADQLQAGVREEHKEFQGIANAMSSTSNSLEHASVQLNAFAGHIKTGIEKNAQSVERGAALLEGIEKRQVEVISNLHHLLDQATAVQDGLAQSSTKLTSSMRLAMDHFNTLSRDYNEFRQSLINNFAELQKMAEQQNIALASHMSNLLKKFGNDLSDGINKRMYEWNEQTRTFCDNMTGVVQVMSDIVDGLDDGETGKSSHRGS